MPVRFHSPLKNLGASEIYRGGVVTYEKAQPPEDVVPDTCPGLTGVAVLNFGDLESFDDGVNVVSPLQVTYAAADYPGLVRIRMIGSIAKEDLAYETEPTVSIVSKTSGLTYWTAGVPPAAPLVYVLNPDDLYTFQAWFDDVITLPGPLDTYALKWSKVSAAGAGFQVFNSAPWVFFNASDQAKFQMPLLRGLFLDGVGLYQDDNAGAVVNVYARIDGQSFGAVASNPPAAFSDVDYRELYVVASKFTGSGKVIVRDITAAGNIAATELAIAAGDGVNDVTYSLKVTEANFVPGNQIAFWGQHAVPFQSLILVSGDLNPKTGSPHVGFFTAADLCAKTAEVYVRAGVEDCEVIYLNRAHLFNVAYWPLTTIFTFDGTERNGFFLSLLDTGTFGAPDVPPCAIVTTIGPFVGVPVSGIRSVPVVLVDQHLYASARDAIGPDGTPDTNNEVFIVGAIAGP